jgi:hypothetical protein
MIPPVFEGADRASLTCIQAAEEGETARRGNALLRARDRFAQCAAPTCPAVVRKDCATWLEEVAAQTPSIVIGAHDKQGRDVLDATASLDGVVVQRTLDGSSIELDPGPHVVRVEVVGAPPVAVDIVVRAGEKNRPIVASMMPAPPFVAVAPPPPAPVLPVAPPPRSGEEGSAHHGLPAGFWVLGGIGVVALGGFATFALLGKSDSDNLHNTCAPDCSSSQVSALKTKLLAADIALGVAVVSLATATWIGIRF